MSRDRDLALVDGYLAGREEEAFRSLYREHTPYLYRLALRLAGGRDEVAEEAVQEAWIRATAKLADFRWSSTLRTWLGGFVVNCCREARRRRRPETTGIEAMERDFSTNHTAPPVAGARLEIERLLAALPDDQRDVVVLFAIEGYTHEEIAHLLDIPAGTSKSRLFDARRSLRRWRKPVSTSGGTR